MIAKKYVSQADFQFSDACMEKPKGKSMTIKGSAYTIKELLEKFTRGLYPSVGKDGIYEIDVDDEKVSFDDINPFTKPDADLSDIDSTRQELNELKGRLNNDKFIKDKQLKDNEFQEKKDVEPAKTDELTDNEKTEAEK